jgi:hypothetical protein
VLSKLAYLAVYRSMQAPVLLARGDAANDLEILVLRTNAPSFAARSHDPGSSR